MRTIQMISVEENAIFLCGFDQGKGELSFRSSLNPGYLQTEKIAVNAGMVYTNTYYFPVEYLEQFIKANHEPQ